MLTAIEEFGPEILASTRRSPDPRHQVIALIERKLSVPQSPVVLVLTLAKLYLATEQLDTRQHPSVFNTR